MMPLFELFLFFPQAARYFLLIALLFFSLLIIFYLDAAEFVDQIIPIIW